MDDPPSYRACALPSSMPQRSAGLVRDSKVKFLRHCFDDSPPDQHRSDSVPPPTPTTFRGLLSLDMRPSPALFLIYFLILTTILESAAQRKSGKITIGYVGASWLPVIQSEVARRRMTNIKLREVKVELQPRNLYASVLEVDNYIQNNSQDIILGHHSLSLMSITGIHNIPYLDLDTNATVYDRVLRPSTVFSFPIPDEYYARAVVKILDRYNVDKVAILIDETADYQGFLEPFFKQRTFYSKVWTLHSSLNPVRFKIDITETLKYLRKTNYRNIVIKANIFTIRKVIDRAHYLAMVASPHKWYFPSVVCDDFGYTNLRHINTNFTFVNDYCNPDPSVKMYDDQALIIQAFDLLTKANWSKDPLELKRVAYRPIDLTPFMSPIQFNEDGMRTNVTLQIHVPTENAVIKVGNFHSHHREQLHFHPPVPHDKATAVVIPRDRNVVVVGVVEHPHLMWEETNNTYIGFGIDILNFLARYLNFTYTLKIADNYGNFENGRWTGVMDDLLSGRADMTLGPLVQSRERENVIDFSTTFKQREISIVMRRPLSEPSFFQFARPFDIHVWGCVIASIIFMSFTLWLVEKGSARANRCDTDFKLRESAWFIFATTVQGGTENIPRSMPGRILTGTLYFFVLILTTSYTANLAAFLTVKSFNVPISKVEDLPNQKKIKFGTVLNSGVLDFFSDSEIQVYKEVYDLMHNKNPSWMVNSSEHGFERARREDYAFIWDDSVNEYEVNIEDDKCELMVVGRSFGKRSFAIGLPQGSRLKEDVDKGILSLIDSTALANLEHKWWKAKSRCSRPGAGGGVTSRSLSVFDVAGVLLVLFCGCALSLIALLCETFVVRVLCRRHREDRIRRNMDMIDQNRECVAIQPLNANNVREFQGNNIREFAI